jgi:chromosome segregation ATPase
VVTEGLNKIAVGLAEQARGILEDELVVLDVDLAQSQHEVDILKRQLETAHNRTTELWRDRKHKAESLRLMSDDIQSLKRPREGYPHLDDAEYEMRMMGIRVTVHGVSEELTKRVV